MGRQLQYETPYAICCVNNYLFVSCHVMTLELDIFIWPNARIYVTNITGSTADRIASMQRAVQSFGCRQG